MNAKLKKKWVDALMSGKYEQGSGLLFYAGQYCCLGVLGECAGMSREEMYGIGLLRYAPVVGRLPISRDAENHLAELNDEGIPFEVIAGFIQENL